jgi:hypothetical protein
LLRILPAFVILLGLALSSRAEVQLLTDNQGRSIKADVLAVTGDQVKIKRDDGKTFELPLASLTEENQRSLRQWAAKGAAEIPGDAIMIELSRGVFDSSKREDISTITTEEKWGYNVTASNRSSKTISDLRFDYVLFVKPDFEPGKDQVASKLKRSTGSNSVAQIASISKIAFRTSSIKIYKQKLKPGWIWGKTGNAEMLRDTLYGIWIKAYVGDQLVAEVCTPESLAMTEKGP